MVNRLETYLAELQADPIAFLITMAYTWFVILFSLILHECAHGYVAYCCGDPTAKRMGRLSLNPARHLDPIGTLFMFVLGFGWAKPVPVNPRNFRNYRRDDLLVSVAGVAVNLFIFVSAVLLSCLVNRFLWTREIMDIMIEEFGEIDILVNPLYGWVLSFRDTDLALGASSIVNDGHALIAAYRQYMQHPWLIYIQRLLLLMAQVNLTLAVFNLLPIPPLDGFHLANDILFKGRLQLNGRVYQMVRIALVVLMFTGVLGNLLSECVVFIYDIVLQVFLMLTGQAG